MTCYGENSQSIPENKALAGKRLKARLLDQLAHLILWLSGITVLGILAAFLILILYKGLPVLKWSFITGASSYIRAGGGVGAQFFNFFYILVLSMLFAIPIALGGGIYLAEYAGSNRLTSLIRLITESLATVPSIVLGLFGMIVFVEFLEMGFSILGGALTLSLLNTYISAGNRGSAQNCAVTLPGSKSGLGSN